MGQSRDRARDQRPQLESLEARTLLSSGQPATETKPYYPPGLIAPAAYEAGVHRVKPVSQGEGLFFNAPAERRAFVVARPGLRAERRALLRSARIHAAAVARNSAPAGTEAVGTTVSRSGPGQTLGIDPSVFEIM